MKLLVLKHKGSYLKIGEEGYELVDMSKASVFPIEQKVKVLVQYENLKTDLLGLEVKELEVLEKDFA